MAKMKNPNILDILFTPHLTVEKFNFQALWAPPLYSMLTFQDVEQLRMIATSIRYNANIDKKYQLIDQIMRNRGFRKFAGGTNRIVYACEENSNILLKIAIDRVGMKDNPAEYINQWTLQPYVCKCFEVSQCGTVGLFERLIPITHLEEFANIANDVFDIVVYKWLGKYVLDDIGTKYFMNWAIRKGFGPCLIDFPYLYKLDSNKLYCNKELQLGSGIICGGEIDYDAGFNDLICTRCGKKYIANQLEDHKLENQIVIKGGITMKVGYYNDKGELIVAGMSSDHININKPNRIIKNTNTRGLRVNLVEVEVSSSEPKDPFKALIPEAVKPVDVNEKEEVIQEPQVNDNTKDHDAEELPSDFNGDDEDNSDNETVDTNTAVLSEEEKRMIEEETIMSISNTIPQLLDNINEKLEESKAAEIENFSIHAEVFRAIAEDSKNKIDKEIEEYLAPTESQEPNLEALEKVNDEYDKLPSIEIGSKFINNKNNNRGKPRDSSGRFRKQFDEDKLYEEEEDGAPRNKKKKGGKSSKIDNF